MKKALFFMLLLVIGLTAMAQQGTTTLEPQWTSIISNSPETFQTQLISSTENSIKVNVSVPGFYKTTVTTPQGEAYVITVPKSVSTAHAGEPDVPMTGIPIMIGDKARMNARVIDAQYMDFENFEVAPSKGDFPRSIDPATVPYTYGECYSQNAFFPASNLDLYEPYIIRDIRGQNLAIYPFAYNPVTKTLRVYYNMTVEMYKVDDQGTNVIANRRGNTVKLDPDFKSMYQRHFINYEASMNRYTPLDENGDLLIICYDNFISSMTDFVNWKKTRGINTTIVSTNTTGTTYSAIKTYIQNQYNANNNITHVLLVGDVAQIPGYSYSGGGSSYSGLGDNAYGQIVGNDVYNDVIIGRFSASSAARVTTQCNRAIAYERDLNTSATWLQVAEGISRKENGSGHNNEDDYEHMNNIRTDLLNYGYTTVYQRYANLTGYTATSSQISTDINSGVGIINYANHGQETAWGSNQSGYVYYANSHVNALTNENKLPFIFSVACLVGKYDHSSDCFAEAWMNATNNNNPTGAVGTLMSYISQPWIPPMWAQDECIDILVGSGTASNMHTFGGIAINGLMGIFDHYSTSEQSAVGTYQAWIVYGDPSLMVRTKTPQAMTVTHSGNLPLGTNTYSVNVSNGNGAVATITDANHNILGKATVNNGSATITVSGNLTQNQELTLCVFGYNKVTYLGTIDVIAAGEQYTISANVNPAAAGTVSGTGTFYENTTHQLTATANTGYGFTNWTLNGSEVSTSPTYTFTVTGNATYTANFHALQQHHITYEPQQTHGSISVSPANAYAGDIVTLTATPNAGYVLDYWDVSTATRGNVTVTDNKFTMPDEEVTVTAVFRSEPLTVADGAGTNDEIPFYGLYADDNYQHTQTIYPASMLTNMQGTQITKLTYYLSSSVSKSFGSTFQVRFGTTTSSAFNSGTVNYISITDSPVYSGTLSVDGTTVEFDFSDNPYLYSDGNLVVDVRITALGSGYKSMNFYGESGSTYYSVKSRSTSSLPTTSGTGTSFMPKTTFTFTAPTTDPYISLAPNTATVLTGFTQNLTATYGNVTGTPTITYTSSNASVATVSGSGTSATVTAVAPGTATITATMTVEGTPYTATCAVTVEEPSYCEPSFSNPSDDYISKFVTTGGTTNINNTSTYESNGFSDYYNSHSASITAGETLSCTVTPNTTNYSYGHAIWVDWNKDYVFSSSERVAYTTSTATGNWTGSFVVPSDASAGDYRMRVIHYYNNTPTDACMSATYGEAEDYKLTVLSTGAYTITCATATGGTILADKTSADENDVVTITATPETDYLLTALTYTPEGGSAQSIDITSVPYTFTMPAANVTVNATFSLPPCPRPTNLAVSGITPATATLNWTSDAGQYNVRYRKVLSESQVFFDGFESGIGNWTTVASSYSSTSTDWRQFDATNFSSGNVTNHTGDYVAMSRSYDGSDDVSVDNWLISPQVTLDGTLKYWVKNNDGADYVEYYDLYVSTTGNSISDFTLLYEPNDDATEWTEKTVDLSGFNGASGYIAFRHHDTGKDFILIDDISINAVTYSAWTTVTANGNTVNLAGLDAESTYQVQVQADCGSVDGTSSWSSTASFTTLSACTTPAGLSTTDVTAASATLGWTGYQDSYNVRYKTVYFEGFEDGIPSTWTTIDSDGDGNSWLALSEIPSTYSAYSSAVSGWAHSGSNAASSPSYVNTGSSSGTAFSSDQWLVSPKLNLQGSLKFHITSTYADEYEVKLSTTGTSVSDFNITLQPMTAASTSWDEVVINLSDYAGQQGHIAIHHVFEDGYFLIVDDFSISEDSWHTASASQNTVTVSGLEPDTSYVWQVQGVNCDGNGSSTDWSEVGMFVTEAQAECPVITAADLPYTEDFEDFTDITNVNKTGVMPECWTLAHEYFTPLADTAKPQIYYANGKPAEGDYCLGLFGRVVVAMPQLGDDLGFDSLKMGFYLRQHTRIAQLEVGVLSELDNAESFTPIDTLDNGSNSDPQYYVVDLRNYQGSGKHIAFRNSLIPGYNQVKSVQYIDSISLFVANSQYDPHPDAECNGISLPYSQDFDNLTSNSSSLTGVMPDCWDFAPEQGCATDAQIYCGSANASSGSYSLYMSGLGTVVLPEINNVENVSGLSMKFSVRQKKFVQRLQVGVMDDPDDASSFVKVADIYNGGNYTSPQEHIVKFSSYSGNGKHIAFRNVTTNSTSISENWIDDIHIYDAGSVSCGISVPYTQGFETGDESLECWNFFTEAPNTTEPQLSSDNAQSGSHSFYMSGRGYLVLPEITNVNDMSSLSMSFYVKQRKYAQRLEIGVMSVPTDPATFVKIADIYNGGNYATPVEHTVDFASYPGSGRYIVFRNVATTTSTVSQNWIDDISIFTTDTRNLSAHNGGFSADGENGYTDEFEEVTAPLGVDEFDLSDFSVWPNPTTGLLTLATEAQRVEILSLMGQRVAVFENTSSVNISDLPAGVYILKAILPQGEAVRKVVKR